MIMLIDFLKTALVMGILDFIWLSSTKSIYNRHYSKVQCGRDILLRVIPAIVAYTIMFVGFVIFVLPFIRNEKTRTSIVLLKGAFFGLVVYGVYNATCMAVFKDFPLPIAIMDTVWGMTIYALTTAIFMRFWKK
jgi:uncharacterized membrane protein